MLNAIPSPPLEWNAITLGPLTIHVYALWLLTGIAVAAYLTQRRLTRRGAPGDVVLDIVLWAVPLGIVGARIYHVLTHTQDYFYAGADLWDVVRIWDGGNAIFGSLIGGAVGAWIACRRAGIRFWSFADALAPAMLVAQAIGRGGNWWNHELFGNPTTLPWGLEIDPAAAMFPAGEAASTLFHPLFLYEALWNLAGAGLLLALDRRFHLRWGRLFALYMVWYGLGRAWLELLRIDPTSDTYLGLPANSAVSILVVLLGIALFVVRGRQHPELEESVFVPGREPGGSDEAGSHGAGSDDAGSDGAGSDGAGSDGPGPDGTKPVGAKAVGAKPDGTKAGAAKAGAATSDDAKAADDEPADAGVQGGDSARGESAGNQPAPSAGSQEGAASAESPSDG